MNRNDRISIEGIVISEISEDYDSFDRKYVEFQIESSRLSDTCDYIDCVIRGNNVSFGKGDIIRVTGSIQTERRAIGSKKTHVYVFCEKAEKIVENEKENNVSLTGIITRIGKVKHTPLTKRVLVDFGVVVNDHRAFQYIPAAAWGGAAYLVSGMKIGDKVNIEGRLQSRDYEKSGETLTAHEVSCKKVERVAGDETIKNVR